MIKKFAALLLIALTACGRDTLTKPTPQPTAPTPQPTPTLTIVDQGPEPAPGAPFTGRINRASLADAWAVNHTNNSQTITFAAYKVGNVVQTLTDYQTQVVKPGERAEFHGLKFPDRRCGGLKVQFDLVAEAVNSTGLYRNAIDYVVTYTPPCPEPTPSPTPTPTPSPSPSPSPTPTPPPCGQMNPPSTSISGPDDTNPSGPDNYTLVGGATFHNEGNWKACIVATSSGSKYANNVFDYLKDCESRTQACGVHASVSVSYKWDNHGSEFWGVVVWRNGAVFAKSAPVTNPHN